MNLSRPYRNVAGLHATLSPSSYHWLNYTEDKLVRVFNDRQEAARGTRMHAIAKELIETRTRLPETNRTYNMYVNDGIGFKMNCEFLLFYSKHCFGHPDCISFRNNKLRIHDLKTGKTPGSMDQLLIYAALFCLDFGQDPRSIEIELRIYQNDEVVVYIPEWTQVIQTIDTIKSFCRRLDELEMEDV